MMKHLLAFAAAVTLAACNGPYDSPTAPTPQTVPAPVVAPIIEVQPFHVTIDHGTASSEVFQYWRGLVTITRIAGVINPPVPTTVTMSCGNGQPVRSSPGFYGESWFSCAYAQPGTYIASTTATGGQWTETASTPVIVLPSNDPAPLVPITMFSTATSGQRWTFFVNAGAVVVPIGEYRWNFGDGSTETTADSRVTHVYQTSGIIIVTVTAITRDGRGRGTARDEIIVGD